LDLPEAFECQAEGAEALRSGITRVRVKKEDISVLLEFTRINLESSRRAANFHAELVPHGHLNLECSHRIHVLIDSIAPTRGLRDDIPVTENRKSSDVENSSSAFGLSIRISVRSIRIITPSFYRIHLHAGH
jgi:hypothetical protein